VLVRKYNARKNYREIFKAWDENKKGKIDANNVENMCRKIGLKLNN
jgi:Ca2+-binding EF-hand superfamily protein